MAITCDQCKQSYEAEELRQSSAGLVLCRKCCPGLFTHTKCDVCGEVFPTKAMLRDAQGYLCRECAERARQEHGAAQAAGTMGQCSLCGKTVRRDEMKVLVRQEDSLGRSIFAQCRDCEERCRDREERCRDREEREAILRLVGLGLLLVAVGFGLSAAGEAAAKPGGTYILFYGAILVGAWMVLRGLLVGARMVLRRLLAWRWRG